MQNCTMCEIPRASLLNLVMGMGPVAVFLPRLFFSVGANKARVQSLMPRDAREIRLTRQGEDLFLTSSQSLYFSSVVMGFAEPSTLSLISSEIKLSIFTIQSTFC